jgi:hypothetical protein
MAITPQKDVLSWAAAADGQWRLSRLRNWLDPKPVEETIVVPGLVLGDRKQWFAPIQARLIVSDNGRWALAVASCSRRPQGTRSIEYVDLISLVDLRQFIVVKTVRNSDLPSPTSAFNEYYWDRDENLVIQAIEPFPRKPGDNPAEGGVEVRFASLHTPDLTIVSECRYTEFEDNGKIQWRSIEHACDALLKSAPGQPDSIDAYVSSLTDNDEKLRVDLRGRCEPPYVSADGRFARELCARLKRNFTGRLISTSATENIYSLPYRILVGSLRETKSSFDSRFTVVDGRTYLLVIEDGQALRIFQVTLNHLLRAILPAESN